MKEIAIPTKYAKSFWARTKGLVGEDEGKSLYFQTRFGIHTFGMKFPIDVVILNDKFEVVRIKTSLKPNRVFLWNPKYSNVLELPVGSIKKFSIKRGLTIHCEGN